MKISQEVSTITTHSKGQTQRGKEMERWEMNEGKSGKRREQMRKWKTGGTGKEGWKKKRWREQG